MKLKKNINNKDFPILHEKLKNLPQLSKLYPSLYHATTISAAKSILKEGLLTQKCGLIHGEMDVRPEEKTIYLSSSEFSGNLNTNLLDKEEQIVVIEINTKSIDENKIYPDDGMWCAFANGDFLDDKEEVSSFFGIPIEEGEKLFNLMEDCTNQELVQLTKPLWKLYLIQEGEISISHDIKKGEIINIRDMKTQEIIKIKNKQKKLSI